MASRRDQLAECSPALSFSVQRFRSHPHFSNECGGFDGREVGACLRDPRHHDGLEIGMNGLLARVDEAALCVAPRGLVLWE
ncbi:MAG: hypothetical protein IV100_24115 [Myxococcales bacterium]|nr:hypothetical protein [Myxococcales bacterium]